MRVIYIVGIIVIIGGAIWYAVSQKTTSHIITTALDMSHEEAWEKGDIASAIDTLVVLENNADLSAEEVGQLRLTRALYTSNSDITTSLELLSSIYNTTAYSLQLRERALLHAVIVLLKGDNVDNVKTFLFSQEYFSGAIKYIDTINNTIVYKTLVETLYAFLSTDIFIDNIEFIYAYAYYLERVPQAFTEAYFYEVDLTLLAADEQKVLSRRIDEYIVGVEEVYEAVQVIIEEENEFHPFVNAILTSMQYYHNTLDFIVSRFTTQNILNDSVLLPNYSLEDIYTTRKDIFELYLSYNTKYAYNNTLTQKAVYDYMCFVGSFILHNREYIDNIALEEENIEIYIPYVLALSEEENSAIINDIRNDPIDNRFCYEGIGYIGSYISPELKDFLINTIGEQNGIGWKENDFSNDI